MAQKVKPIPEGYHTLTPYLVIKGADRAIDFYIKAFGATELFRMPGPDGAVMHAEITIGDSHIMLAEENPEMGAQAPTTLNGTPVGLFLYVENADGVFKKAVDAGASVKMPLTDMFWGDRWGVVVDPFGHQWQIATHMEDLSPEEIAKRAEAFQKQQ